MDNANLEKLKIIPGKLVPKFKSSVTEYSVTVASSVAEIKLTPLTSDTGASYTIKGSDGGGKVVRLEQGQERDVEILVCAEDGSTSKTYTIATRRLSADDATLSELVVSVGFLAPPFSPFIYTYECCLPCSADSISMRAKTEEEAMKLTMKDGSSVGTIKLNPGMTLAEINVESVNGKGRTTYSITFIKCRNPAVLQLKSSKSERFECAVCCGVVHKPTRIKGGPFVYCNGCLEELTRTNKTDPFTQAKLEEEGWMERDLKCDEELGKEEALCSLSSSVQVEGPLQHIGGKLMAERARASQDQETTEGCKECSKKIPQTDLLLHNELLCTAKHPTSLKKKEVKVKAWETRLIDEATGSDANELMKGLEWEGKYIKSLPNPGESPHYPPDKAPLDHLLRAARCYATAIRSSPKDAQVHLALGLVLEEFFYVEDLFGMKRDEDMEEEGEAETSSKEEEFLAICKLHGVGSAAPVAIQLKAIEAEYHSLKEAGQTHKAEHVQGLHAWKSKKALEASQGSYSVDTESPLYRAKLKFQDAVSISPSDGTCCYHLGRICLLLGEREEAKEYLMAAVALKPTLSPARFCLGFVLMDTANHHAKNLLLHGLTKYLQEQQLLHETKAEPHKTSIGELHSKIMYRRSNTLIIDGFLHLSSLSGHGHLSTIQCLLNVTSCVCRGHLHHRASTYEKLLWSSLKARSLLLNLLHKENDPSILKHCRQLSALISFSELKSTPQLRKMQIEVFQLGVLLQPSSSAALCHLGNGQLMEYEASNDAQLLKDAEFSFRSSIEMEGKTILPSLIPDMLKNEEWWENKHATKAPPPGKPVNSASSTTSNASTSKKPVTNIGRPQPPSGGGGGGGRGKSAPGKVVSPTSKPGGTAGSSRTAATKKPPGGERGGVRLPAAKTGPTARPSGRGTASTGGKSVATLGELKTGSKKSTTTTTTGNPSVPNKSSAVPTNAGGASSLGNPPSAARQDTTTINAPAEINKKTYHPRLGLARTLSKTSDTKTQEEAHSLYHQVTSMAPHVHDAYIELGEMLATSDPVKAVEVYAKFPFNDPPTFDDAFLHGEIIRLLMKSESYEKEQLVRSMIAMGKALGIGVLDKQVAILEGKFKSSILKQVYAGVHGKSVEDPELVAFFKFKCWL